MFSENESLEVKIQPKYGILSNILWKLLGGRFNIAVYYKNVRLIQCTELRDLPLMIRNGFREKVDTNEVEIEIEKC